MENEEKVGQEANAEPETIIETIDLVKVYGVGDAEVIAVNGISIKICTGEFVAIMGQVALGKVR